MTTVVLIGSIGLICLAMAIALTEYDGEYRLTRRGVWAWLILVAVGAAGLSWTLSEALLAGGR